VPRKLLLFLYSRANIVGSGLGLLGLALFFTGIIQNYWFFIVAGLYAIGVLLTPASPSYDLRLNQQLNAEELRRALEKLVQSIRGKVPPAILAKVESITASISDILPRLADLDGGDYNLYTIRQTVLDYLPEALEHYLNLPRAFAKLHPVKDGKTATQLLLEQLDLLDRTMQDIAADIHRNDTQQLLAHGRFLQDKFREDTLWLGRENR